MTNDERLYYIRLSKAAFVGLTALQQFLDVRKIVKSEATEDAEAVYYDESDALPYEAAMRSYRPHTVALMQEGSGAPINLGSLADHDTLPDEMTHAFFALNSPKIQPLEIAALVSQINAVGGDIREVLIPWGAEKDNYLNNGTLPS